MMRMPVNNHIYVVLNSRFDNGLHQVHLCGGVAVITLVAVAPVFVASCHGGAHNLNVHVVHHGGNAFFTPEFNGLRKQAPIKAHAAHLHFGAILYAFAATVNAALALRILAGHQLTVLANRTHAGRSDVRTEHRRNKTEGEYAQAKHLCTEINCHISSDTPIFTHANLDY